MTGSTTFNAGGRGNVSGFEENGPLAVYVKANFPPDMRSTNHDEPRNSSIWKKAKNRIAAIALAVGAIFSAAVVFAGGVQEIEKAVMVVYNTVTDKVGVDKEEAVSTAFNANTESLYAALAPVSKIKPTIDQVLATAPESRESIEGKRQQAVKAKLLSNTEWGGAATKLFQEFETAGACLTNGSCNGYLWHKDFDGAFCASQRTYGAFINQQQNRLPTYASEYSKALATIDCSTLLYPKPAVA